MDSFVVQAWIDDVATDTAADEQSVTADKAGPPSFPTALSSQPVLTARQAQPWRESERWPSSESRSMSSPTERLQMTADLLRRLAVPVQFVMASVSEAAVPRDARPLAAALAVIASGEALLPAALKSHPDFQNDSQIRWFTWCDEATASTRPSSTDRDEIAEHAAAAALHNHDQLRAIINMSNESAKMRRSEAAWNNLVHTPFLLQAGSRMPRLGVEVVTSAQIMSAFRPLLPSGRKVPVPSSETSGAGDDSSEWGWGHSGPGAGAFAMPVDKMVDYALVLRPSDALQALIDDFLRGEPWERDSINQTRYGPLRAQPAPVFVETGTAAGAAASVQLGIWVAAWLERMRSIASQAGTRERMLTLPVIRVVGSVWSVLYVVDEETHIRVLRDDRPIGSTTTVLDIYKLQASMAALGRWVDETFTPWFENLLTRAVENRRRS